MVDEPVYNIMTGVQTGYTTSEVSKNPNTNSESIRPDQGYVVSLEGIAKSDLAVGQKLGMAWDTTKYYFRGSQAAQGTAQALGGVAELLIDQ